MTASRILALTVAVALLASYPASAFWPPIHDAITRAALGSITVIAGGELLAFSEQAINDVVDANTFTDCGGNLLCVCNSCQSLQEAHVDGETFEDSTKRLQILKANIIFDLTDKNAPELSAIGARFALGQALHTIQDFYSHSTWVELDNRQIQSRLGRDVLIGPLFGGSFVDKPCLSDGNTLSTDGSTALTSGFFSVGDLCANSRPVGKCRHGDIILPLPFCPGTGISKDHGPILGIADARRNYDEAKALAIEASRDFVNQILSSPGVAGNTKVIKALMGIKFGSVSTAKSTLGIVIDDTTSMTPVIEQVKTAVIQIVNSVIKTPKEPAQYLLERFGDPDVGPPFVTDSSAAFLDRVNALFAHGEGNLDCPELQMTGLLQAVAAAQPGSTLFLFTDDKAKDAFEADSVIAAALRKQIQVIFVLAPPSCNLEPPHSARDTAYDRIAQATGGQVFDLGTLEIAKSGALMGRVIAGDQALVLAASGSFSGATTASSLASAATRNATLFPPRLATSASVTSTVSSPQTFMVAVDSSATSVTFSVSVAVKGGITLLRPSGAPVLAGQPGVTLTDLSSGQIITVDSPEAGNWLLQVAGSGPFSVLAWADSSIQLYSSEFVKLAGRPGHPGYFPTSGLPVNGTGQTVRVRLLGSGGSASLKLLSETGAILQTGALAKGDPNAGPNDLLGTVDLPTQPFRVLVTGQDAKGLPFQRIFPTFFRVQSVEVAATSAVDALIAGTTTTISFAVRNLGAPDTFQVVVTDDHGFISRVDPTSVALATNASANVDVDVTVPPGAAKGTSISVSAAATSTIVPGVANGTTQLLTVVTNNPLPAVSSLSPSSTAAGSAAFNLDVVGSNFVPGAIVRWNGSGRTTTFVSDTKLTALIAGSDIATGSTAQVKVFNPSPGGGESSASTFAVADFSVAASPPSATIRAGQTATYTLTVIAQFGSFGNAVSLSCSGLPALSSCSFAPLSVTPNASPVNVTLTVSTTASSALPPIPTGRQSPPLPSAPWPTLIALFLAITVLVANARKEKRLAAYVSLALVLAFLTVQMIGCAGGGKSFLPPTRPGTPTGAFNITVIGSSGSLQRSTTITLKVQ